MNDTLSENEINAIVATGVLKVEYTCPPCTGTGFDTSHFYRWCGECYTHWDDGANDRTGTATMEAWEKDPRAKEMMPCGHRWDYYHERDADICSECEGSGKIIKRLSVKGLAVVLAHAVALDNMKKM